MPLRGRLAVVLKEGTALTLCPTMRAGEREEFARVEVEAMGGGGKKVGEVGEEVVGQLGDT